jgi:hypothetical protein
MSSRRKQGAIDTETVPYAEQKATFEQYTQEIQGVVTSQLEAYPEHVTNKPGEAPPTTKVLELAGGITLESIESRYERGSRITVDEITYQVILSGPHRHMMRIGEGISHVMPWDLDTAELDDMVTRAKKAAPSE